MSEMLPLEVALERMVGALQPLPPGYVGLLAADGLMLAQDVVASRTQPPFDVSAMDGYALLRPPKPGERFIVVGEVPAGSRFTGPVEQNETVRIFTGAPLPHGARHVCIQEDVERVDDVITILPGAGMASHVRPKGGDFAAGDLLLSAGLKLNPQALALAAAGGHARLRAHPRPTVAVLMNGDELVWPHDLQALSADSAQQAIIASNGYAVAALVQRFGGVLASLDLLGDDVDALAGFAATTSADILVTIGGSSVGDHDLVRPALMQAGFDLAFPKVALRPGKPTLFGTRSRNGATRYVLGLPGNPVSAIVAAMLFLKPLIARLAGSTQNPLPQFLEARLGHDIEANGPRAHFMRATQRADGHYAAVTSQDSSLLVLLNHADALIYRPANAPAAKADDPCQILSLEN